MSNIIKSLEISNKDNSKLIKLSLDKGRDQIIADILKNVDKKDIKYHSPVSIKVDLWNNNSIHMEVMTFDFDVTVDNKEDTNKQIKLVTEANGIEEKIVFNDLYHLIKLNGEKDNMYGYWEYQFDNMRVRLYEQRIDEDILGMTFNFELFIGY